MGNIWSNGPGYNTPFLMVRLPASVSELTFEKGTGGGGDAVRTEPHTTCEEWMFWPTSIRLYFFNFLGVLLVLKEKKSKASTQQAARVYL